MINDNCPYGRKINQNSISLIRNWILALCTNYKKKNIFEKLFGIINNDFEKPKVDEEVKHETRNDSSLLLYEEKELAILKSEIPGKLILKCKAIQNRPLMVSSNSFEPIFDIIENNEKYIIILDMPGVEESSLNFTYTSDKKTIIEGKREKDFEGESKDSLRGFGQFHLKFKIPKAFSYEANLIEYANGALRLEYLKEVKKSFGLPKKK